MRDSHFHTTVRGYTLQEITKNARAEIKRFFGEDRGYAIRIEPYLEAETVVLYEAEVHCRGFEEPDV